jgi:hypothetical protein
MDALRAIRYIEGPTGARKADPFAHEDPMLLQGHRGREDHP